MSKLITTTTALALLVGAGTAFAAFNTGDRIGTTEEEVRAMLEAKGATIEEIEIEDGEIEVEFMHDGVELEVAIDIKTGVITEIDTDDNDDDKDPKDND